MKEKSLPMQVGFAKKHRKYETLNVSLAGAPGTRRINDACNNDAETVSDETNPGLVCI